MIDCPFKAGLPGGFTDYPFKAGLPGGVGYGVGEAIRMRRYQTVLYVSSSHAVSTCVEFNYKILQDPNSQRISRLESFAGRVPACDSDDSGANPVGGELNVVPSECSPKG